MKVSRDTTSGHSISAYEPGRVYLRLGHSIIGQPISADGMLTLTRSVIVSPQQLVTDWSPQRLEELHAEHLDAVLALQPEVVLLGTGARLCFPQPPVLTVCYQAGVGVEVMDTGAACRTFNILAAEGRNVVAALLMIGTD